MESVTIFAARRPAINPSVYDFAKRPLAVAARPFAGRAPGWRPDAEYSVEIDYGLHATGWLIVRPDVHYVVNPGGYDSRKDVVILSVKSAINF